MSEPQINAPPPVATPPRGRRLLRVLVPLAAAVAVGLFVWQSMGRKLWKDVRELRREMRDSDDSAPVGYLGINYRRSYNDRPPAFHFEKDGKKTLWAAKGVDGLPDDYYDVTSARFDLPSLDGGFGRDSIPGIDYPIYESPQSPRAPNLHDRQEVLCLDLDSGHLAFPKGLLEKIEVVNGNDSSTPFVAVYDRGRGLAFSFRRTTSEGVISLGTTGYSSLKKPLLYDRKTKSLWLLSPRDELVCVNGKMEGMKLDVFRAVAPTDWAHCRRSHPDARVLIGNDRSKPIPSE